MKCSTSAYRGVLNFSPVRMSLWLHFFRKSETKPKTDTDDPSAGIMDLMKKMYDEGDDDMKRTIAKAWTESRDKKGAGSEGPPGLGDF